MIKNANLDKAFEELRFIGYFAKRNNECCRTCGWYVVPDEFAEKAVFTHSQDEDSLEDYGGTYLNWSGNGKVIVGILEKNGISTEWDGSADTRIRLFAEDERTEKERVAEFREKWGMGAEQEEDEE